MVDTGRSEGSGWRVLAVGVLGGLVVAGLMAAAFAIGHNRGRAEALREAPAATEPAPATTEPAPTTGTARADEAARALFTQTCGSCHTLAAAGTTGTIGPNLDDLAPSADQVLAAIANGGTGSGQMPPGLLQGARAEQVAEFVAAAAGG